ncbi:unnamed protein product [Lactuca saligna]|uniref:Uncharacterized protein n=1 Tax=Lactuca saligna TaxID=75948 RepID=A0AA35V1D0_LACSI|nr:unnamed protein product [Lactuca saligna]CAI9261641.1 unnamed protein product [Lactuca saligna]CAI9262835.1 unnamed protein product [Lactuca saligna]CAI9265341.1 unnamed protein product [Lactuca saligna]
MSGRGFLPCYQKGGWVKQTPSLDEHGLSQVEPGCAAGCSDRKEISGAMPKGNQARFYLAFTSAVKALISEGIQKALPRLASYFPLLVIPPGTDKSHSSGEEPPSGEAASSMGRSPPSLTHRMGKTKQRPAHSPEFGWGTAGIEHLSASLPPLVIPLSLEPMVTNLHRTNERTPDGTELD